MGAALSPQFSSSGSLAMSAAMRRFITREQLSGGPSAGLVPD
jgi:hypothetical protein